MYGSEQFLHTRDMFNFQVLESCLQWRFVLKSMMSDVLW